jgi:dihydrofolate reductase
MAGPDGDLSWHRMSPELHAHVNNRLAAAGGVLEGRVNHELMAEFWPTADDDPDAPAEIREFAEIWRNMKMYVFSRTLEHDEWATAIVRDVVPEEIEAMKRDADGDLFIGGAQLGSEFLRLGLVDELTLHVNPVVVGAGRRMFEPQSIPREFALIETRTFPLDVVMLRYERSASSRNSSGTRPDSESATPA